ncbi:HNH endonuclease [Pantoea sp. LMR881]|uniref:HNH endonuclease n=1 Tax=Pantoea sp. LMR881 TaxID=3014336 RepID=UPI003FA6EBE2
MTVRNGQSHFRNYVLGNFGWKCAVTDLTTSVEAAHITAFSKGGGMTPGNGVALVSWLHKAYDAHAFCIHPLTLTVHVRKICVSF